MRAGSVGFLGIASLGGSIARPECADSPSAPIGFGVAKNSAALACGSQARFQVVERVQWTAAAGVAAFTAAILWWTMLTPVELVAKIADEQQVQLWRIESLPDRAVLRVAALPTLAQDTAHAYELWALSAQGGAPVSLGLLPQTGTGELQLNDAQQVALASAQQVAVSLEPVGGSPTGAPTGPVLFIAAVLGNG